MKKLITLFLALVIPSIVFAQTTANDLVGLCAFDGNCATYIADNVAGGAVLSNAGFLTGRNQANSANVNLIGIDTGDNTLINSSAADLLIFRLEDDVQRLISFDGSADTLVELFWGDGGTTAAQNFDIRGGTSDTDDDQRLCLTGGGACADSTRGAYITLSGEEDADGGDVVIESVDDIILQTSGSGDVITLIGGASGTDVTIADNMVTIASGTELTLGGDIISTTTNIGAVVATGANTACNTTCAVANGACIFGWDTSGTQSTNVACDGATADECLCLAAS